MNNSIYIILNQYKKGHITEEEAIQLIEDLYKNKSIYVPIFPYWTQTTYEQPQYKYSDVTCKQ